MGGRAPDCPPQVCLCRMVSKGHSDSKSHLPSSAPLFRSIMVLRFLEWLALNILPSIEIFTIGTATQLLTVGRISKKLTLSSVAGDAFAPWQASLWREPCKSKNRLARFVVIAARIWTSSSLRISREHAPGTRPTRSAPGPGRIAWPRPPRVMCGAHCQIFKSALVSRGRQPWRKILADPVRFSDGCRRDKTQLRRLPLKTRGEFDPPGHSRHFQYADRPLAGFSGPCTSDLAPACACERGRSKGWSGHFDINPHSSANWPWYAYVGVSNSAPSRVRLAA